VLLHVRLHDLIQTKRRSSSDTPLCDGRDGTWGLAVTRFGEVWR
jgi:hypothetical protein